MQVSGATAMMVASGLGFKFRPARKGEHLASIQSSDGAKELGVNGYRVRYVNVSGNRRRVEADLIGNHGSIRGLFTDTRSVGWSGKAEDATIEHELKVDSESVAVRVEEGAVFHIRHNGRSLGSVSASQPPGSAPAIDAFTRDRRDLLTLLGNADHDISRALARVATPFGISLAPATLEATWVCVKSSCSTGCSGAGFSVLGPSWACEDASADLDKCCRAQQYGQSCCQTSNCNCQCYEFPYFYCNCQRAGKATHCDKLVWT
jgi:hypothetical protein